MSLLLTHLKIFSITDKKMNMLTDGQTYCMPFNVSLLALKFVCILKIMVHNISVIHCICYDTDMWRYNSKEVTLWWVSIPWTKKGVLCATGLSRTRDILRNSPAIRPNTSIMQWDSNPRPKVSSPSFQLRAQPEPFQTIPLEQSFLLKCGENVCV